MIITATRYHDISCGHRVAGHESKCANLHGHNYRVHFTCQGMRSASDAGLDTLGRVLDFSVIKSRLCMWLEEKWDHRFLAWTQDAVMREINFGPLYGEIVWTPFNPTAENMARYLLDTVGPSLLVNDAVDLIEVVIEETRKCSAGARKETR